MKPWFKNVKPHKDIQEGHLDESVFAANLAEVADGTGREIYTNPDMFFQKTYFTVGLKNIAKRVVLGLNGGQDAENRVISLQTGFGGGKTHTLISLYHLAKWAKKLKKNESVKDLISFTGEPKFENPKIAVFTNTTNDPVQGRIVKHDTKGELTIRTLWGELAYQLGGIKAYETIRMNDEKQTAPKGLFKQVLNQCKPALILIDELADYCVGASAVKVEDSNLKDQTISFIQELTEAVSGTDQCVMIATLPASAQELAASAVSAQILTALENRITRVGANLKPVEDEEIFEVVRRRLFEDLGDANEIEKIISAYSHIYQTLLAEVPSYAIKTEYKDKMRKSYPFHPELIDMFRLRWASNPHFQRTRGVLRLLASIVSDLWKRQMSLTGNHALIHTSDVHFANLDAVTSQITMLYGANWDSVINADISGTSSNSFRIDQEVKTLGQHGITQGIASTILLGTFGSQGQNKGVSLDEMKLCMIKPDSFNHNDINGALDRLEDCAHYLYYSSAGQKRYWFHTKPNINILINQAKSDIKNNDIESDILKRIVEKTRAIQLFNTLVNPSSDIPEQQKPTLIILSPRYTANSNDMSDSAKQVIEKIATKKGNSERIYRNTMLFLVCSELGTGKLQSDIRDYLACHKISMEYSTQLEKEQKDDIKRRMDEASKQAENSLVAAYSIVIKYSVKEGMNRLQVKQFKETLDSQINNNVITALIDEEWLLKAIGLNTLKTHQLFPTKEKGIKVKDIYEAFLRFDDKPMITGPDAVTQSLLKYCYNKEFCIAAGDGTTFTKYFLGENVPFFDINDPTYWLLDKSLKPADVSATGEPIGSTLPTSQVMEPGDDKSIQPVPCDTATTRIIKSVTISGKVPLELYTQLWSSFIVPLQKNNIEIEIRIKGKSTSTIPITESSQEYKIVKESAKQLGLKFEEEG